MSVLSGYSTKELLKELLSREEGKSEYVKQQPVYEVIVGKISTVRGEGGPFARKKWEVEIEDDLAEKVGIPKRAYYMLLGGRFNKDYCPIVGDEVKLRCRITKARPVFTQRDARIVEIIKRKS